MNKKFKWAAALVLLLFVAVGLSDFYLSGREIASFEAIAEDCEVIVVRHDPLANQPFREYTLEGPQIKALKELLQGSSYTRRLTFLDKVSYHPISYCVYVYFDHRQEVLFLDCLGEDYIFISSSFEEQDYYDLRINQRGWRDALEGILAAARETSLE